LGISIAKKTRSWGNKPPISIPYAEKNASPLNAPPSQVVNEQETVPMEEMPVLAEEAEVVEAPLEVLLDAKKPLKIFPAVSHNFSGGLGRRSFFLSFHG